MDEPFLKQHGERPYYGIAFAAPYRGMFARVAAEGKKLEAWIKNNPSPEWGPRFLRYRVIDMQGMMALEIGVFGSPNGVTSGPAHRGVMPAGRYATLLYRGLGLAANRALLSWIEANGWSSDRAAQADGDAFACRYEAYLTDPKVEPRKKHWDIELAIKLRD